MLSMEKIRKWCKIFKLKEYAESDKKISSVGGIITEPKKITPLVLQASDNLFVDIKKTFPKKLAKMISMSLNALGMENGIFSDWHLK